MIVILEGPDGSGKSTLAKAILGYCKDNLDLAYVKSPAGKTKATDDLWSVWVKMNNGIRKDLVILDRTPEISEAVYGFALKRPSRVQKYLRSWGSWPLVGTVPVFCVGQVPPKEDKHLDPWGTDTQKRNYQIDLAYNFLAYIFQEEFPGFFSWDWRGMLMDPERLWYKFIGHLRHCASTSHYPFPSHWPDNFWTSVEKGSDLVG